LIPGQCTSSIYFKFRSKLKELTEILTECRTSIVAAEDEESRWVMNLMNKLCQGTTYSKSENQEEKGTKEKKRQKYNRKYI